MLENKLNILLQELIIEGKTEEAEELASILFYEVDIDNVMYKILCSEILLKYLFNYKKNEYFYIDYLNIKFEAGKGYRLNYIEKFFNKENIINYDYFKKGEKIKVLELLEKNIILINS